MKFIRAVILPTIIAAPIWMQALQVQFNGWSDLGRFDWRLADWIFGLIFTFIGVVLIGLPAASILRRRQANTGLKVAVLLIVSAAGGGAVAILYVLLLGIAGGGFDVDLNVAAVAAMGIVPGLVTALVWIFLNFASLTNVPEVRGA